MPIADVAGLLRFELPPDWSMVAVRVGVIIAPTTDVERFEGDPESLPLSLLISVVPTPDGDSPNEVISRLMRRRVPEGYPDQFESLIDGATAQGYDWTDGILSILSWFVIREKKIVEFSLGRYFRLDASEPLESLGERLLRGVTWQAP